MQIFYSFWKTKAAAILLGHKHILKFGLFTKKNAYLILACRIQFKSIYLISLKSFRDSSTDPELGFIMRRLLFIWSFSGNVVHTYYILGAVLGCKVFKVKQNIVPAFCEELMIQRNFTKCLIH